MGGAASVPDDSTRSLKVIGAGYSRTGTLSMAMALETLLNGPVMHGGSQLLGREDCKYIAFCISLAISGQSVHCPQRTSSSGPRSSMLDTTNLDY